MERLRTPTATAKVQGRAAQARLSTSTLQSPRLRVADRGGPLARGKVEGGGISRGNVGSSTRKLSLLPSGWGSGDTNLVYVLVGLNVLGTLVWLVDTGNGARGFLSDNLLVSTYSTVVARRIHGLVTTNFSHSNVLGGAIHSYIVYSFGPMVISSLGRNPFLALYLGGGAFSQLCQVVGPMYAKTLNLPSVLQVDPFLLTSGGSAPGTAMLAWYCASFPGSQVQFFFVPVKTGVIGGLFLAATLYQVVSNGDGVPFLGGPPQELWRTLGAAAAGIIAALLTRGGRGRGRYNFIKRY